MGMTLAPPIQEEIMNNPPEIVSRIDDIPSSEMVQQLQRKVPEFNLAYDEDGLESVEMEDFGPCKVLNQYFINGFKGLCKFVDNCR